MTESQLGHEQGDDVIPGEDQSHPLREREFRLAMDAMPHMAWIAQGDGSLTWFNKKYLDYTGCTMEELIGEGWIRVLHPDEVPLVATFLGPVWRGGEPFEITVRLRAKGGEYRSFISRGVPIRDEKGVIQRWIGTQTDITEQLRAQETLQRALEIRNEFMSIASHELRTPLASLQLQLQLLWHRAEKSGGTLVIGPSETALALLTRQTNQLRHLVDEMFDVARIDAGRFAMNEEYFDVGLLVRETFEGLRPKFEFKDVELTGTFENKLGLRGDKYRIAQVIMNLMMNALNYGEKTPVRVSVRKRDAWAEIIVQDSGRGIAPEDQHRIFRRFERAVSLKNSSGLGLGLYISDEIVRAHGGAIHLWSEVGHGATFQVTLPLEEPPL